MSEPGDSRHEPMADTLTQTVASLPRPADYVHSLPKIARYTIVRRLGGGGMGDVYEAIDEVLGVTLALKIVRPDRSSASFRDRFRQEIRAMMGLEHPNIARVYSHDESGGLPYFTMKFVGGGTLADRIADYRDRPREAVALLLKVIDAIDYLHRNGQIHRDLKPSNILLTESGEPLVSDFGLVKELSDSTDSNAAAASANSPVFARTTSDEAETCTNSPEGPAGQLTRTGARIGTSAYMSPEQARGEIRRIGPASDIWALGIILHEMITGHRPVSDGRPRAIDPGLDRVIAKCLSQDQQQRYASAAELAADLRRWVDRPRVRARRRWQMVAAVAVLVAGVAIYLTALRPRTTDPAADWRAWARKELAAGRPVTLIDAEGNAAPTVRFLGGERTSNTLRDPAGWWTVNTTDAALLEFLDDPGVDDFTISGEMRPTVPAMLPLAGFFTHHRQLPNDGADWHFQVDHVYLENGLNFLPEAPNAAPPVAANRPNVGVVLGGPRRVARAHVFRLVGAGHVPIELDERAIDVDARAVGGPWRTLAIHAYGDGFATSWERGPMIPAPGIQAHEWKRMQSVLDPRPDPPLGLVARGGVGIIVENGSMAFRNVIITPSLEP